MDPSGVGFFLVLLGKESGPPSIQRPSAKQMDPVLSLSAMTAWLLTGVSATA